MINIIESLPSISDAKKFNSLSIWNEKYFYEDIELPSEIGEFINLVELSISYCNKLIIPKSLSKLTKLRSLKLINVGLTQIPEAIYDLLSLEELDLSNNYSYRAPGEPNFIRGISSKILQITKLKTMVFESSKIVFPPQKIVEEGVTSIVDFYKKINYIVTNQHIEERNFSGIDFSGLDLSETNFRGMNFSGAKFNSANLRKADFYDANLTGADLRYAILNGTIINETTKIDRKWRLVHQRVNSSLSTNESLTGEDLSEADLSGANLSWADLSNAILCKSDLRNANLSKSDLTGADLSEANLQHANLSGTNLIGANLSGTNLSGANLDSTKLKGANLSGVDISERNFTNWDLSNVNLTGANLNETVLVRTNFSGADLSGSSIYGISAWDLNLENTIQSDLVITPLTEPAITVDNLQVAQFIYLLLNNAEIRGVIDTITSKVVLILGRFTEERKVILNGLRNELRKYDYLPILFDFEKPGSRDLTETISTLAHMARFIIADITDAKSIPQELQQIVPDLPSVPVQPIIESAAFEYGMFEHFKRYPWVLPLYQYDKLVDLSSIKQTIISPAESLIESER